MRNPHRKFLSLGNHFFKRLKTADSSTACGTVTLKSLLSLGSDAPHVHLRLRKRLSRCTLDCGFKTSESPALRGFVGGLRALATAALYLVLKSNGLLYPKIQLKKFDFSSKTVPANIAKKLPSQRCSKPLLIAIFNFPHKRPTFAFACESGYTHSAFGEGSHTRAYTPKHRASLLSLHGGLSLISHLGKQKPKEADARLRRVSASPRRRSPAGLRNPVCNLEMLLFCALCAGHSACTRLGWYHYSRCVSHAVETPGARLPKRLICRFSRPGSHH